MVLFCGPCFLPKLARELVDAGFSRKSESGSKIQYIIFKYRYTGIGLNAHSLKNIENKWRIMVLKKNFIFSTRHTSRHDRHDTTRHDTTDTTRHVTTRATRHDTTRHERHDTTRPTRHDTTDTTRHDAARPTRHHR